MRIVAVTVALVLTGILVMVGFLTVAGIARWRRDRLRRHARWRVRQYTVNGDTVVAVALTLPDGEVLEDMVVEQIPQGSFDWTERFLMARHTAEERAVHLNTAAVELPPI